MTGAFSTAYSSAFDVVEGAEWITDETLKVALGIEPADSADDAWISTCVAAVNRYVDGTRKPPLTYGEPADRTDPTTVWGALQLGTRWYSRRNSNDLSAFAELGGVPPSIDRDIEATLKVGRHFRAAVA